MKREIYRELWSFCQSRNLGPVWQNGREVPPRVSWILALLEELRLPYELDPFEIGRGALGFNLYLKSESPAPLVLMAHHDIVNPLSDNANDNSASVINSIAAKLERPDTWVVLTDGEEAGGLGAQRYSELVESGRLPAPVWVLNLELTGLGGLSFFVGDDREGPLKRYLVESHGAELVRVPFNDSCVLRRAGIDSCVVNPLPKNERGEFELFRLGHCHSLEDSLDRVSHLDMKRFVEGVLLPVLDGWPRDQVLLGSSTGQRPGRDK